MRRQPEADGANLLDTVVIPNPSVMTLHFGNVTLDLSVNGTAIGTTLISNLVLRPGENEYPMRTTANQTLLGGLVAQRYTNGIVPIDIAGSSVVYNGQRLPYYEVPLRANKIRLDLNVGAALRAAGITLPGR